MIGRLRDIQAELSNRLGIKLPGSRKIVRGLKLLELVDGLFIPLPTRFAAVVSRLRQLRLELHPSTRRCHTMMDSSRWHMFWSGWLDRRRSCDEVRLGIVCRQIPVGHKGRRRNVEPIRRGCRIIQELPDGWIFSDHSG